MGHEAEMGEMVRDEVSKELQSLDIILNLMQKQMHEIFHGRKCLLNQK